jgi:hypothetical protein
MSTKHCRNGWGRAAWASIGAANVSLVATLSSCAIDDRNLLAPGSNPVSEEPESSVKGELPLPPNPAASSVGAGSSESPPTRAIIEAGGAAGMVGTKPDAAPALEAHLEVDVQTLDLGSAVVGQAVSGRFTLVNTGGLLAAPMSVAVSGPQASDFAVAENRCANPIPVASSCVVNITFEPSATGARAALAQLASGDGAGFSLPLVGIGLLPGALSSNVSGHDFEGQEVAVAGDTFSLTVTNSGQQAIGPLTLTQSNPAEFLISNACTASLDPGASCSMAVRFQPAVGGPRSGQLELQGGDTSIQLSLTGSGRYRLSVVAAGNGTVQSVDAIAGLDCGRACSALVDPGVVRLYSATLNGANSHLSGWSEASCGPSQACDVTVAASKTVTANFADMTNNLIFVSSALFPATLGSVAAYDRACNRLATAAGINTAAGNGFIAAISAQNSFLDRIPAAVRGWVRMDGLAFGDQRTSLLTGQFKVDHAAHFTELGTRSVDVPVRHGTYFDGTPMATGTCSNWTRGGQDVATSGSGFSGPAWLWASSSTCDDLTPVYCMGVTKTAPLVPRAAQSGKRLWVTRTPYVPGSTTPDQKCRTDKPSSVANAVAFISTSDRAAAAVIDPAATYVRPDGVFVGTGAQVIALDMTAGPWVLADGTMVNSAGDVFQIWTGSSDPTHPGTAGLTCSDWQTSGGRATVGGYGYDNYWAWDYYAETSCAGTGRLYCVEP